MKNKTPLSVICLLALGTVTLMLVVSCGEINRGKPQPAETPSVAHSESSPVKTSTSPPVPAFQTASEARNLPPTLPANQFFGKAREAYRVAGEIPQTLAQLPCYCHCDRGFGHKSLHTCFVDDHASHCAVCVDEALLAFQLQRQQKLNSDQIREKIIEKYGTEHRH